ncbi:glycosyltransferase family 4 protein [Pseudorhodobacter turbinis]|uniref:Glycosyltransferase family 4 protein n=1 Tax=Pseudorhodobacter turbinis TaxID=2500533 RepID=A0A4P8EH91_9RHOB|nr:glycosyltransferase [Pseudorhodobacter turbinis]QCO56093.1 glycosyltransferase family 4 protein [Pseudorhodobacter turbinis]
MAPPARLLDLTRLLSRIGKGQPTGVDRVEAAYLGQLLGAPLPVFGLIRSQLGYLLLDREGMGAFQDLVNGRIPLPRADILSRLTQRKDSLRAKAETAARRLSIARARQGRLQQMLQLHLPQGFSYLNVGHANLTDKGLTAVKAAGGTVSVMLHDTIPMDHPAFTRADTVQSFERKLAATATHADLVIHTACVTRTLTEGHLSRHGRTPSGIVAPLGILPPDPAPVSPRAKPYFVTVGTIEPRKNHAFLLDLWETFHRDLPDESIPDLLILGRRGWANEALFQRLDALPFLNRTVFEMPNLPDRQVMGLLANARALLFPSLVEGYGLPPLEAASLGVPVLLPPLPIYRETLGEYPVYLALEDGYSWQEAIIRFMARSDAQQPAGWTHGASKHQTGLIPRWEDHFNTVLSIA